jgi:hypothetical protein
MVADKVMQMRAEKCYNQEVPAEARKGHCNSNPACMKNYYDKIYQCAMKDPPVDPQFAHNWLMNAKKMNE